MNLAIDIGNSQTKAGWFKDGQLIKIKLFANSRLKKIPLALSLKPSRVILSSVIHHPEEFERYLRKNFSFISLSPQTPLPVKNKYKTPATLGKDRIAAVAGAHHRFPGQNLLVIDAGTCITYDFVNKKGEYFGGSISPGINMRFMALHTFTHRLPLIKKNGVSKSLLKYRNITGRNTRESILSGVLLASAAEMDGMIEQYRQRFPGLKTVITGGDAPFFAERLKNKIFAVPNLVLLGLNTILEYNTK